MTTGGQDGHGESEEGLFSHRRYSCVQVLILTRRRSGRLVRRALRRDPWALRLRPRSQNGTSRTVILSGFFLQPGGVCSDSEGRDPSEPQSPGPKWRCGAITFSTLRPRRNGPGSSRKSQPAMDMWAYQPPSGSACMRTGELATPTNHRPTSRRPYGLGVRGGSSESFPCARRTGPRCHDAPGCIPRR